MIPPRYTLFPSAVLRMSAVPIKLRWTYLVLYAMAWRHDYRFVTETLDEMAIIFDDLEEKRVTARIMRSRINGLIAHGLLERKRAGVGYTTTLLVRHDVSAPIPEPPDLEEQIAANLPRGRPGGKVSRLDEFAYDCLEELGCEYEAQYHPPGCPYWYDVLLLDANLLIELDSEYWHRGERAQAKGIIQKDRRKDAWARDHGFEIVRLMVSDVRDEAERTRLREMLMEMAERATGDPELSPLRSPLEGHNTIKHVVDEEVDDQTTIQQQHLVNTADAVAQNESLLRGMGVMGDVVHRLAREEHVTPGYLEQVMAYRTQEASRGKTLGPGWVVKCVGEGWEIPKQEQEPDRYRYIQGRYKDFVRH